MFSPIQKRDNTEAADMPGVVPANVRSETQQNDAWTVC
jgi:hypothetical protein